MIELQYAVQDDDREFSIVVNFGHLKISCAA